MGRVRAVQSRALGAPPARALVLGTAVAALGACASHTVRVVDMTPPQQFEQVVDDTLLLDVGVTVFDANVPEVFDDQVAQNITPEVRRAEANFMAYFAKNLLQSTGNWGAVRVVPRATHAVDVTLTGTIVHSDGERMILHAEARDARGTLWFDKTYEALASKYAYGDLVPVGIDPFHTIYRNIADDMLAYRKALPDVTVRAIRTTAEMRFARDFSPDAFEGYVVQGDTGVFAVQRLPAEDDPNLDRVRKVREREYLFIDTLDEYFEDFSARMYPTYQGWRQATYSEAIAYREQREKAKRRAIAGAVGIAAGAAAQMSDTTLTRYGGAVSIIGGAAAVGRGIQAFADAKVHSEVLQELGASAEAEISPHTIELENRTLSLQGTVEDQYEQLRRVLKRIYYEELGLALPELPDEDAVDTDDERTAPAAQAHKSAEILADGTLDAS